MCASYNEAVKAQKEIEDKLLKDPNVVSVGVVAEVNSSDKPTGSYVVQVGVISINIYQNAQKLLQSVIPLKHPIHNSTQERYVRIDVIQRGVIERLSKRDGFFPVNKQQKKPVVLSLLPNGSAKFHNSFDIKPLSNIGTVQSSRPFASSPRRYSTFSAFASSSSFRSSRINFKIPSSMPIKGGILLVSVGIYAVAAKSQQLINIFKPLSYKT